MNLRLAITLVAFTLLLSNDLVAQPGVSGARRAAPDAESTPNGYLTRVDTDSDELLKLENGAVVEITSGYLGYLGYRKRVILYQTGSGCKIWIEGKRLYRCDLVREPKVGRKVAVEELSVSSVSDNGEIIKATDGRVFEVNSLYTIDTTLWLAPFDAVLIDGSEMVNLEEGDEPVAVSRLR